MNKPVAAVTVTAPSTSRRWAARSGRLSGTTARMVASRTMPTGTLMKKTQRQPGPAVRGSPTSTPAAEPKPPPGGPHAQGLVAFLAVEDAGDGRQRGRGQQRSPDALTDAAADQQGLLLRQAAGQR